MLFPVEDPRLVHRLRYEILATYLADNVNARRMQPDGEYVRVPRGPEESRADSQGNFIAHRRVHEETSPPVE
jgi:polyphosphate kinase